MTEPLKTGQMYLVVHQSEIERKPRASVMRLLEERDEELIFDARPTAGTQTMPRSWIISIQATSEKTPSVNRRFT